MSKETMMSLATVAGAIAILTVAATIAFIWAGKVMPDWWGAVVVSTIIAKLFNAKTNGDSK